MANPYLRRPTRNLTGLWLTVAVLAFVIGWRLLVIACGNEPPHWRAIAAELGSVPQFKQDLSPNSTGTRLVFCQDTEKGVGIYFCETDSGKKKLLCEQKEKGYSWQRFSMLGWSPDDKLFAYAIPLDGQIDPGHREEQIVVCNGLSGEMVAKISVDPNLYELAWMSPYSFVYSTDFNYDLKLIERNSDGKWVNREIFQKVSKERPENLIATSEGSVAWQEGGDIWSLDFESSSIKKIWESGTNQLVDFTYSKEAKEFLLNGNDSKGPFCIRFDPFTKWTSSMGRVDDQPNYIASVTWINGGSGYVYVSADDKGEPVFCIKTKPDSVPIRASCPGLEINTDGRQNYILSGDGLFFTCKMDYNFPGIWEYDIKSRTSRCIVLSSTSGFVHAKITLPLIGIVTNAAGWRMTYRLWQPVHVSTRKKYPLIITEQLWNVFPYAQIAVNEGFYFAVIDQSCVVDLYKTLAKNPNIDTNRVYFYASSVHSSFASEFVSEKPDLWKGAILFCPIALPGLPYLHNKRLLIIDGENDPILIGDLAAVDRLMGYQDQAAKNGIPVALSFLNGSGHTSNSINTERMRAQRFSKFLSED